MHTAVQHRGCQGSVSRDLVAPLVGAVWQLKNPRQSRQSRGIQLGAAQSGFRDTGSAHERIRPPEGGPAAFYMRRS